MTRHGRPRADGDVPHPFAGLLLSIQECTRVTDSLIPEDLSYTKDHEWVRVEDGHVRVGITHFAQDQLGDVVYVDLPPPGTQVEAGQAFGEVESTKSVSDLYAPLSGSIGERNDDLEDRPELVNEAPYAEGWLVTIQIENLPEDLMDAAAYRALIS